jgi:hypothetical protein
LATSRNTAPVSLFSPKFLVILSTRRANCRGVLCPGRNPNCSSRSNPHSPTSFRILVSKILSNSLPIVSNRLLGRKHQGSAGSVTGFRMEITRGCFHAEGK